MRNLRNSKGFTLIELMIVVVIIGILAAIAIPKFTDVAKSAKESEADPVLKQAYTLQESYKQRYDIYADDAQLTAYGWAKPTDAKYYAFSVVGTPTSTAFCVEATPANDGVAAKANVTPKNIKQDRKISNAAC